MAHFHLDRTAKALLTASTFLLTMVGYILGAFVVKPQDGPIALIACLIIAGSTMSALVTGVVVIPLVERLQKKKHTPENNPVPRAIAPQGYRTPAQVKPRHRG